MIIVKKRLQKLRYLMIINKIFKKLKTAKQKKTILLQILKDKLLRAIMLHIKEKQSNQKTLLL